jgi:hypothetical protein
VIALVHLVIAVQVHPPATSEIAGITGTKFRLRLTVHDFEFLEATLHWERVCGCERLVVESLAGDVDDAYGFVAAARKCRGRGYQRNCTRTSRYIESLYFIPNLLYRFVSKKSARAQVMVFFESTSSQNFRV